MPPGIKFSTRSETLHEPSYHCLPRGKAITNPQATAPVYRVLVLIVKTIAGKRDNQLPEPLPRRDRVYDEATRTTILTNHNNRPSSRAHRFRLT